MKLVALERPDVAIVDTRMPLSALTPREREILALMAEGRSNFGVAGELSISKRTVEAASAQAVSAGPVAWPCEPTGSPGAMAKAAPPMDSELVPWRWSAGLPGGRPPG